MQGFNCEDFAATTTGISLYLINNIGDDLNITSVQIGDYTNTTSIYVRIGDPVSISLTYQGASGGELAAMTLIDAAIRLIPDVLGKLESLSEESFSHDGAFANLLEYPHYTRPQNWQNLQVPKILLSGNHQEINKWRLEQAKKTTKNRRPDLWKKFLEKTE